MSIIPTLSLIASQAPAPMPSEQVLQANTAAIVVVIVIFVVMVLLVISGRKKKQPEPAEAAEAPRVESAAAPQLKLPASKESFEPLPTAAEPHKAESRAGEAKKAEAKAAEPEPEEEDEGEVEAAWELAEDEAAAEALAKAEEAVKKAEAKKQEAEERAREKAREAEDKRKEAAEKTREAEAKRKAAEEALARAADEESRKKAEQSAAEAKAAAEQQKKVEQEARAEAARAAEARDKAIKEAAEKAKAEAKAAAEAEARAKAEAKRKEAEAKAKAEAEARAKAEAEEAKKREAEAKAKKKEKPVEDEGPAKTLKDGLGKTRKEGFIAKLSGLFAGKQIDQDLLDEVEEALFTADIGVRTADRLLSAVREALSKKELKDESKVWEVLRGEAFKILEGAQSGGKVSPPKPGEPFVTMVLGVNGTGKTTSIGKMAHKLLAEGKSVTLVAGDTFRAAATEQLEHWARRVGAPCIKGKEGADPASVVFDGVKKALEDKAEFVLVDTAGRLHNNVNLMEELKKVRRVMGRAIEGAPHEVLMVLDATTGQNGIAQAKQFKDATDVTGIILTKLDGTAKGGVVLGVCDELKIPIRFIGIGERVADLRVFDPKEFVDELFAPPA